jgi:hypothetical protein
MTAELNSHYQKTFWKDLQAFRAKYPMTYIEAWTPDDFEFTEQVSIPIEKIDADWFADKHIGTVEYLTDTFNANLGTSWDSIQNAIKLTLQK